MFHVALRILWYDKVRSLITLTGVIFAIALVFAQAGIFLGLMRTSSVVIDNTPGDIWITSKNTKNFDFSMPIPEFISTIAASEPGILWAEKLIVNWGYIKQKDGGLDQVEIVGYNPDTGIGGPWWMKEGDPRNVRNGKFAIVDESAFKRLGNAMVGDYRDVNWKRLEIVGICRGVKSFTTAPMLFVSYEIAQGLIDFIGPDNTVFVVAKVAPGHDTGAVVTSLRKRLQGVDVYTGAEFSAMTRMYWAVETGVGFSFFLTILISLIIGMVIVGQTIYNSTMEHIKEFGTLKALGAGNGDIYRIIFSQAFLNSIVGYLISLVLTAISVQFYEAADMVMIMDVRLNLLILFLTFLICFGAAAISMRRIRRIDPAILFRG